MNESKQTLLAVINTLDQIEVHGEENLDMLLACIRTLKGVVNKEEDDG